MQSLISKIKGFYHAHPNIFLLILSLLLGFLMAILVNQICSFVYANPSSDTFVVDAASFVYGGKLLLKGYKPYFDFYDQKGIYIYYYTALGLLMGGRFGITIVQTIVFTIFYYFFFKTLLVLKIRKSMIAGAALFFFAMFVFSGQSPSDFEIDLPFIMISLYYYSKARTLDEDKFYLYGNIFTGITTGISLNLRASDAMVPLALVIYFGVRQIISKRYKTILPNSLICVGAIIVSSIPPLMHAYFGGFLREMFEASFLSNFTYISTAHEGIDGFKLSARLIIAFVVIVVTSLLIIMRIKKRFTYDDTLFFAITLGFTLFIEFIIAYYLHYLLIITPIGALFVVKVLNAFNSRKVVRGTLQTLVLMASLAAIVAYPTYYYVVQYNQDLAINEFIQSSISKEDRENGSVLCYQTSSSYYLNNNIWVGYGDFAFQINHMVISKSFTVEALKEYILSPECKYVIMNNNWYDELASEWIINESGLTKISSSLKGAEYISIYQK